MRACDARFRRLLDDFDPEWLRGPGHTIYGMWPDLTLAFVGPGWFHFAADNGGADILAGRWPIGRSVMEAIAEPLRPFFARNYRRSLSTGRPWTHAYECSSPRVRREMHMTAFPLGDAEGLLAVHSLLREVPQDRPAHDPIVERYRGANELILQCCHSRRACRDGGAVWDWVPAWVRESPPMASHGLCPACYGFYYSEQRLAEAEHPVPFHA